jgi:thiol-disulfide isomerase/thioredoxin/sugar lactone lactonase YvrE
MRSVIGLVACALVVSACTSLVDAPEVASVVEDAIGTDAPDPITAGGAVGGGDEESDAAPDRPELMAPEFPDGLEWINVAAPLRLSDLRGKVVLLDFWTYGCINCLHIIPDLERLEEEFREELVVIGVHSAKFEAEGSTEAIEDVVARYDIRHPVVNDKDFEVWRAYGARAWPTIWLIHPDGTLVGRMEGEGVYEVVQPVIADIVREEGDEIDRGELALDLVERPRSVLSFPGKVEADPNSNRLAIADTGHDQVVVVDRTTGAVEQVFGSGERGFIDGAGLEAAFDGPQGLAFDGDTLYVADTGNHAIRAIDLPTGLVTTVAGTGEQGRWPPPGGGRAAFTDLYSPWDLLLEPGGSLVVAMAGSHQLWRFDPGEGIVEPWVGNGRESVRNGPVADAELAQPSGLASGADGTVYFADSESSSIRLVAEGSTDLLAGASTDLFTFGLLDGSGAGARFQHPKGVEWFGGAVWVADTYNDAIRRIDPVSGSVVTVAGGLAGFVDGATPRFDEPGGISAADGLLWIADTNNDAVRILDPSTGVVETLIVTGIQAFRTPAEGDAIALEEVEVAEGTVELVIDVEFPEGYKLNPQAPSSFTVTSSAGTVGTYEDTAIDPTLPILVPLEVRQQGVVSVEVAIVYCEEDQESICLFEQVVLEVPVLPGGTAKSIDVVHTVVLP